MAYGQECETLRFAWRNIRFVLAGFGLGLGQNEMFGRATWMESSSRGAKRRRDPYAIGRRRLLDRRALGRPEGRVSLDALWLLAMTIPTRRLLL